MQRGSSNRGVRRRTAPATLAQRALVTAPAREHVAFGP